MHFVYLSLLLLHLFGFILKQMTSMKLRALSKSQNWPDFENETGFLKRVFGEKPFSSCIPSRI